MVDDVNVLTNQPRTIGIPDPRKLVIKTTFGALIIICGIILAAFTWGYKLVDASFMTDAAYASEKEVMQTQVAALKAEQGLQRDLLEHHIEDFQGLSKNIQLADAVSTYRNAEQALYLHKLDEERNGATSQSAVRRQELTFERDQSKDFRDCVVNDRPNCEALRPR